MDGQALQEPEPCSGLRHTARGHQPAVVVFSVEEFEDQARLHQEQIAVDERRDNGGRVERKVIGIVLIALFCRSSVWLS